jgi:uncharacterized protein
MVFDGTCVSTFFRSLQQVCALLMYQVAYTVNDEKSFIREISAFDKIKDNYPKYLLTLDYDKTNIHGIQKLNVIDWLLEYK